MKWIIGACIVALAAGTAAIAQDQRDETLPAKSGWWVRVDTQKTEASSITLQIGTKASDRRAWRTWHSGDAFEFDVPRDFQSVKEIYLAGTANPKGKTARFCLFFQNVGMKKFDFSGDVEQQLKQSDRDEGCKFADAR